jgi:hypothetical protein
MSDQNTPVEIDIERAEKDSYGNPLIGGASDEQVQALRKNRQEIFATRTFLDKANHKGKTVSKDWALRASGKDSVHDSQEERDRRLCDSLLKRHNIETDSNELPDFLR